MSTAVAIPKIIEVLLTDAAKWPNHGPKDKGSWEGGVKVKGYAELRGRKIRIIAAPIPNDEWECDSDFLWPVFTEDSRNLGATRQCYVCRHQIQIGD